MADARELRRKPDEWTTRQWLRARYLWWWPLRSEWRCAYLDARARLLGYCNDCPWRPGPADGGGYQHWRCALRRGHEGLHRARNYVWTPDGKADYLPIPSGQPMPDQDRERPVGGAWRLRLAHMAHERRRRASR